MKAQYDAERYRLALASVKEQVMAYSLQEIIDRYSSNAVVEADGYCFEVQASRLRGKAVEVEIVSADFAEAPGCYEVVNQREGRKRLQEVFILLLIPLALVDLIYEVCFLWWREPIKCHVLTYRWELILRCGMQFFIKPLLFLILIVTILYLASGSATAIFVSAIILSIWIYFVRLPRILTRFEVEGASGMSKIESLDSFSGAQAIWYRTEVELILVEVESSDESWIFLRWDDQCLQLVSSVVGLPLEDIALISIEGVRSVRRLPVRFFRQIPGLALEDRRSTEAHNSE